MEKEQIIKKLSARTYLEMMPRISSSIEANQFIVKLFPYLERINDISILGDVIFKELGEKIQDINKAKVLAKILLNDYLIYKD